MSAPRERCGYLGAHGPEKLTGGPEGPPARRAYRPYQLPVLGQAPVLVVVQVRDVTPWCRSW